MRFMNWLQSAMAVRWSSRMSLLIWLICSCGRDTNPVLLSVWIFLPFLSPAVCVCVCVYIYFHIFFNYASCVNDYYYLLQCILATVQHKQTIILNVKYRRATDLTSNASQMYGSQIRRSGFFFSFFLSTIIFFLFFYRRFKWQSIRDSNRNINIIPIKWKGVRERVS